MADESGTYSRQEQDASHLYSVQTGSGAHPALYQMGTGVLSPGVKWPGHEATPILHTPRCLIKHSDSFAFKYMF
jgi:hypothetical protein